MAGAHLQAVVVGHTEDPAARILDLLAFLQGDVQAEKNLLGGFLGPPGIEPERHQVPVDIFPGFFK